QNLDDLLAADYNGNPLSEYIKEEGALVGEKVEDRRMARLEGAYVDPYLHCTSADLPAQGGVLFAVDADSEAAQTAAHDVAVHIAAMSPTYLSRDEVPEDTVANERRIAEETARAEGKPERAMQNI